MSSPIHEYAGHSTRLLPRRGHPLTLHDLRGAEWRAMAGHGFLAICWLTRAGKFQWAPVHDFEQSAVVRLLRQGKEQDLAANGRWEPGSR
jgi:hypothetical protein